MIYVLIILSTAFISSSLNAMEIVTHNENKENGKKNNLPYTIIQNRLITQKICAKILPQDIINHIQQYSLTLKNTDLQNSTDPYMIKWHDFRIPITYHHLLQSKQMRLIKKLLESTPWTAMGNHDHREIQYGLKSYKDYKLFLTLPREMRECLAKIPLSDIKRQKEFAPGFPRPNDNINQGRIIQVHTTKADLTGMLEELRVLKKNDHDIIGHTPQPIVPEENKI